MHTADDKAVNPNDIPRSAHQLIKDALALYRRNSLFFFVLSTGVCLPFQLLFYLAPAPSPPVEYVLGRPLSVEDFNSLNSEIALGFGVKLFTVILILWFLIGPLLMMLHVRAVSGAREGRDPMLRTLFGQQAFRTGAAAVAAWLVAFRTGAAAVAAWLVASFGVALGFVAFVIPGLFLMVRWSVVVQAAVMEREGWLPALRRSRQLAAGHYVHVFAFTIYVGAIVFVPLFLVGLAMGSNSATVASFLVMTLVQVVTWSIAALAMGLLYFDLRLRHESLAIPNSTTIRPDAD